MADFAFGEVTRLLYDAIWSEYCDWGLELAKVRLADDALDAATREATWWTLVEVLDTYLRLLHPVMPFVTEALWATLPHRATDPELLIVARWPGVGERDAGDRGRGRRAHRPGPRDPQRPRDGQLPGRRLAETRVVRAGRARADLRGAPPRRSSGWPGPVRSSAS